MSHSGNLANDEAVRAAAQAAAPKTSHDLGCMTVANLPDPTKTQKGARASVSDGSVAFASAAYGTTVAGGGANFLPVINNGAAWKIG